MYIPMANSPVSPGLNHSCLPHIQATTVTHANSVTLQKIPKSQQALPFISAKRKERIS